NNLADLYRYGRGVAPDLPAAANWYLKAAKMGLASAMNSLGELSEAGTGVPQNDQTAKNWYQKAADLGNADAIGNLSALFESVAAHADCTANCRGQTAAKSETPNANREKLK